MLERLARSEAFLGAGYCALELEEEIVGAENAAVSRENYSDGLADLDSGLRV